MAKKKIEETKKVVKSDKHAITRKHITGNVYSYEYTTVKEKETIKNADSTD